MILRRLSRSLRKQDWATVLVEIVIVVVGVFLGIQASNWNEARVDLIKEDTYLQRLDKDFDIIRERLTAGEANFRLSVESAGLLLSARRIYQRQDAGELPDDEAIIIALNMLGSGMVPAGSSAGFLEMVSSGELRVLKSEKLRNALFEYDQFSDVAREAWRTLRDTYNAAVIPVIEIVEYGTNRDQDATFEIIAIGFDRDRFFNQNLMSDRIGIVMLAQDNQRELVARQLELAEQVELLIAAERFGITGRRVLDQE